MAMSIKKYYWLKLKHDFFLDPKIKKLRRIAGGDTYTVILLKIMLFTLKNDGILIFEGIEKTLSEELALKLDEDERNIEATLIFMEKMQLLVEADEINAYSIPQVKELTGSESESTERVRKHRQNQKAKALHCNNEVTHSNENVTTEKEKEKDLSPLPSLIGEDNQKHKEEREEKTPKTKSNLLQFINELRGKYKGNDDFYPTLVKNGDDEIKVSGKGYLYIANKGDLTPAQAETVWKHLYANQDQIEHLEPQIRQHRQNKINALVSQGIQNV